MKQLFLTSSVHAVAADIASKVNLAESNRLVFIDTAAEVETGDKQWLINDRTALVEAGFDVFDYTITHKTKEDIRRDLSDVAYIYLSGGNTTYLLRQSQQSGFISLIRDSSFTKEKTYIGTSAGSIIAGPQVPRYLFDEHDDIGLEGHAGYHLVDFTILPHWGSDDFKELYLRGRLEAVYTREQPSLVTLTDTQYIYIADGRMQFVDVPGGDF